MLDHWACIYIYIYIYIQLITITRFIVFLPLAKQANQMTTRVVVTQDPIWFSLSILATHMCVADNEITGPLCVAMKVERSSN